ncbi:MAG: DAK2 domain-containing protein, partial [Pauljensenia sp.]
ASDSALAAAALDSAISSSAAAVVATRDLQSQRGRASWLQDRSIGLQDPGATAFLRALEAWRDAATGERGPRSAVVDNL